MNINNSKYLSFWQCYIIFYVFLLSSISIHAQTSVFNTALLFKLERALPQELMDVLVLVKPQAAIQSSQTMRVKYRVSNIVAISATKESIIELSKTPYCVRIEYTEHHLQLMDDTALVRNRILSIHNGLAPLPQAYDGTGVLVGLIDTGIDFTHPDLKDANGNTRVSFLWDMNKPAAANTPTAFGYGQEWNNTEIDLGQANAHSDAPHYGHGTASAGIACGNGLALANHAGSAPKSDIMMVALNFNQSGSVIADAVQYLVSKAQQLNKPLVINASVGDYSGSHDGTDLETQIINVLVNNIPGRALVASAGNAGQNKYHVSMQVNNDTLFTWIKNSSSSFYFTEYADTQQVKNTQFNIGVNNTGFQNLGSILFKNYNYALNGLKRDTVFHNGQRIGIVETSSSINSFGVCELAYHIRADSLNYLWRIEHTGNGKLDSWDFNYVSTNIPLPSQYPFITHYVKADTLQTICSGFQCSPYVITVGNYINRNQYVDVNNVFQTTPEVAGQIAQNSSTGPTRQNLVKPDIAASGNNIFAANATAILASFTNLFPYDVLQGGYHIKAGGTSASSPVVAGVAALYFQKNPTTTNADLQQAIINCAYADGFTTATLPNYRWGYGKLDGFKTMLCGSVNAGIANYAMDNELTVFPNPFNHTTTITSNAQGKKIIALYTLTGELVFSDTFYGSHYELRKNELASGLYVLTCYQNNQPYRMKLVLQ